MHDFILKLEKKKKEKWTDSEKQLYKRFTENLANAGDHTQIPTYPGFERDKQCKRGAERKESLESIGEDFDHYVMIGHGMLQDPRYFIYGGENNKAALSWNMAEKNTKMTIQSLDLVNAFNYYQDKSYANLTKNTNWGWVSNLYLPNEKGCSITLPNLAILFSVAAGDPLDHYFLGAFDVKYLNQIKEDVWRMLEAVKSELGEENIEELNIIFSYEPSFFIKKERGRGGRGGIISSFKDTASQEELKQTEDIYNRIFEKFKINLVGGDGEDEDGEYEFDDWGPGEQEKEVKNAVLVMSMFNIKKTGVDAENVRAWLKQHKIKLLTPKIKITVTGKTKDNATIDIPLYTFDPIYSPSRHNLVQFRTLLENNTKLYLKNIFTEFLNNRSAIVTCYSCNPSNSTLSCNFDRFGRLVVFGDEASGGPGVSKIS